MRNHASFASRFAVKTEHRRGDVDVVASTGFRDTAALPYGDMSPLGSIRLVRHRNHSSTCDPSAPGGIVSSLDSNGGRHRPIDIVSEGCGFAQKSAPLPRSDEKVPELIGLILSFR